MRLGDLDYSTDSDNTRYQDFTISETIKHPNYSYVSSYNDIALLKLHIPAIFDDYVKPACLQTKNDIEFYAGALMVAGWGATQYNENVGSPQLRKAAVEVFTQESCSNIYPKAPRGLNMGIVEELQICAGSYIDESNTCKVGNAILTLFFKARLFLYVREIQGGLCNWRRRLKTKL